MHLLIAATLQTSPLPARRNSGARLQREETGITMFTQPSFTVPMAMSPSKPYTYLCNTNIPRGCHNRQIHKCKILKGGVKKRHPAPYLVKGFRLFDKVLFKGQECFIFGRRSSGSMDVRLLDGTKISPCATYKKLTLLESGKSILTEKEKRLIRGVFPPTVKTVGFPTLRLFL